MIIKPVTIGYFLLVLFSSCISENDQSLVGYWKLRGDAKDYSGNNNHGINHGVDLSTGTFLAKKSYIEVPTSKSLQFGSEDFTISVWINTPELINDVVGDILEKYDPDKRKGITFTVSSSAGGYQGNGTDKLVQFGIDDNHLGEWMDCGRPSAVSNYVSNSLTIYKGKLYAGITGAKDQKDWAHVYRYEGNNRWVDCGRVGNEKTPGVLPLIVHKGELYAATSTYDWTRVNTPGLFVPGRVYKYLGGTTWEPVSQQIDSNKTLTTLASFNGKLYVGGGPHTWAVFTQDTGKTWKLSGGFPKEGSQKCFPHTSRTYRNKLFVAFPGAYEFDGKEWSYAGVPSEPESTLQTHSLTVYRGELVAGTWPQAKVSRYLGGSRWEEFGRVGSDGTEVNSLVVYNGKLYGGSIPRAELARYDGGDSTWTTIKQFYSPPGWTPVPPVENGGNPTAAEVNEWTRVTSMAVYDGKLFASTGSCTSSPDDAPADVRGKVFCIEAGANVTHDEDLGSGWKHVLVVKQDSRLKLYVNGKLVKTSAEFDKKSFDLNNDKPLRIGLGQSDYFTGQINELRIYNKAVDDNTISDLASNRPE
jgi:hypothetical protein